MSTAPHETDFVLGPEHAGMRMTPEEFDAIEEYDDNQQYELIRGVLVVNPIPSAEETGPNELLGYLLWRFHEDHTGQSRLDDTLPQQYVRTATGRRIADRLIWIGVGRIPDPRRDGAAIAVEFVSQGKRSGARDYVEKKREYGEAGLQEYWIIDRFQRTMTVVKYTAAGIQELTIPEQATYESQLLPGFVLPLSRILAAADRRAP
ncbi:MAG: Uma2 family endonuclease [Planctomycetales bacterium]